MRVRRSTLYLRFFILWPHALPQTRFLVAISSQQFLHSGHPRLTYLVFLEIVASFGSDITEDALNYRFRRLRAEAVIIRHGRDTGFDMKHLSVEDLPKTQATVEKNSTQQLNTTEDSYRVFIDDVELVLTFDS